MFKFTLNFTRCRQLAGLTLGLSLGLLTTAPAHSAVSSGVSSAVSSSPKTAPMGFINNKTPKANSLVPLDESAESGEIKFETRVEYSMGTVFSLTLPASADEMLFLGAFAIIRAYDNALSDYNPSSELNRIQPLARQGWAPVSTLLCQALSESLHYGELSDGAFDITVGPLVALWGFKDRHFQVPSQAAIDERLQAAGLRQVQLMQNTQGCRLHLGNPGTGLDFGGIGKGLALDAAADWLRRQGVQVAALDAGGSSMVFFDAPAASPRGWPVLLRQGKEVLWLKNQALASSGDDQQFFVREGVRYGHILNPHTGRPIPHQPGVTVIAATATASEALTKAALILPPQQAQEMANQLQARIIR